jgi:hypothetical protein
MTPTNTLLTSLGLTIIAATLSFAAPPVPEALTYQLLWEGMRVGSSSIETQRKENGLEIVSRVDTTSWSRLFYKIEDVETSNLRKSEDDLTLDSYMMHLQEGSGNWQRTFSVDPSASTVEHVNLMTSEKRTYPLNGQVWDPVSSLYYLRHIPLIPGQSVKIAVIDRQGQKKVGIFVMRKESVTTPAGTFRTVVVSSQMNIQSEGLFYSPGPLTIWLTDDDQRVPVVIEKRIHGLFNRGVPAWLKIFIPKSIKSDLSALETVRAELLR